MKKIIFWIITILVIILGISLYYNYRSHILIYEKISQIKSLEKDLEQLNKEYSTLITKLNLIDKQLQDDIFKKNQECRKYLSNIQEKIWITSNLYFNYDEEIFYSPKLNTCIYWLIQSYIKHPAPENQMSLGLDLINILSGEKYMNRGYIGSKNFSTNIEENDLVIQYRNLIKNMKWN